MPRQQTHKSLERLNESGFASIVIALILIIVLALFTIGFAQLARREQKSALDKQLATQAYYAAESGVNDTERTLTSLEASPPNPDTCLGGSVTVGPPENGVQYTCVLVDLRPPSLVYDNIQPESSRYVVSSTSATPGSITVNWGSADNHTAFPANMNDGFLPAADWSAANRPAVLQFSITPLDTPANRTRDAMMANTFTVYLYPVSNGSGSVVFSGAANGTTVAGNCNTSGNGAKYPCKVAITGIPGGTGPYLFRVIGHYDPTNVSINGRDLTGGALDFDGQRQIDVTGKAHEVLKRLQVRIPKKTTYDIPKDALTSQSTCKHFSTDPVSGSQTIALPQDSTGACSLD